MFRLPSLVNAPFIVSDSIFIDPRYRGTRLLDTPDTNPEMIRDIYVRKELRIYDARSLKRDPRLEVEGFQLLRDPFSDLDVNDFEAVTTSFYERCCGLVKAATGCVAARAVQHEFRFGKAVGPAGLGTYAPKAHADFCAYLEDMEGTRCGRHFAMYNIWRSIDPEREIRVMPLALCDVTTVEEADLVYVDSMRRSDPQTQVIVCAPIHNSGQCWYYFPRMTPDEALIFKQYDTRQESACLRSTFHAAFRDPTVPHGAPLRQSVEVRVMAVFEEQDLDRECRKKRFKAQIPSTRLDGSISQWGYEKMTDWIYE